MKRILLILALLQTGFAASIADAADENFAVHFPMSLNADNTITETVTGNAYAVNHSLSPLSVDGAAGQALRFDGYSNYVKAAIPVASLSTSALTVSAWVAPESYPMMTIDHDGEEFTVLAGNYDPDNTAAKGFALMVGSRGSYKFVFYVSGWPVEVTASDKLALYSWNHLVATIDIASKTCKLYNNGTAVGSASCNGAISTGASDFYIGKSPATKMQDSFNLNTFCGIIDDIDIYNSANTGILNNKPQSEPVFSYPASRYAADLCRPAFHGMPSGGWTNETHGAVYYNGKFNVFFQKNPNGPYMARLNWGHIVSDNLYNWSEERIAISPEQSYDKKGCWSGCVFTDDELTGGKPNIFYTAVDYAKASIAQAVPADDNLLVWDKVTTNPIISGKPTGLSDDFRDCYVFKNNGTFYMIVGTSKNNIGAATLHTYNATTKTWSNDGKMFYCGTSQSLNGTFWEMPCIKKIGDKWMFVVTPQNTGAGVKAIYWIGDINADGTFAPASTTPQTIEMNGMAKQGYGLLSPTVFDYQGKTIMLGIVPDKLASTENYKMGYAHTYSLPREISIGTNNELIQKPYAGLQSMRTSTKYAATNVDIASEQTLSPVKGRKAELCGSFVVGSFNFGFKIFSDGNKSGKVYYSPSANKLVVDLTGVARVANDAGVFDGLYESTLPTTFKAGDVVKIDLFVDHSVLDIFINDTWATSIRIFPTDDAADGMSVFADGTTHINAIDAYTLDETQNASTGINSAADSDAEISFKDGKMICNGLSAGDLINVYNIGGTLVASQKATSQNEIAEQTFKGCYIVKIIKKDGNNIIKKMIAR